MGAANRVFYSITYLSDVKDESKGIWFSAIPEKLMDSIKLPSYGSAKATDLVETAVEDAERCMKQSGSRAKRGELRSDLLGDYGLAMSLVGAYQSIEFIFHRALWLDWRLIEEDDYWFFVPSDIDSEKRWEESLR